MVAQSGLEPEPSPNLGVNKMYKKLRSTIKLLGQKLTKNHKILKMVRVEGLEPTNSIKSNRF